MTERPSYTASSRHAPSEAPPNKANLSGDAPIGAPMDTAFSSDVSVSKKCISQQLPRYQLDTDALKIIRRLEQFGYTAYLVGGCIRDILLDTTPKDFDVVTSARPTEIKRIFRNCRLIGRRFQLAHLHFRNQKVIEVATFRRAPLETDCLEHRHAAENLFGTAQEDAVRRDFTINALMYDVNRHRLFDWTGGLEDIQNGIIRSIGDPRQRIPEDPVRIIRAVKFATKLNLDIEPSLDTIMREQAALLTQCAPARLVEELLKILRSGHASTTLQMLLEFGILGHLLPRLDTYLRKQEAPWRYVEQTDRMIQEQKHPSDPLLLCALFYPALIDAIHHTGDISKEISHQLRTLTPPMRFTKAQTAIIRDILTSLRRMKNGPSPKRARRILDRDYAADAIAMLTISQLAPIETIAQWTTAYDRSNRKKTNASGRHSSSSERRRRPRRFRKRRPMAAPPPEDVTP